MSGLDPTAFLMALGRVSARAAVLVLLVLLVQRLFRKQLSPRWRCALWMLVVARLLLPVSIESVTSIFNLLPGPATPSTELAGFEMPLPQPIETTWAPMPGVPVEFTPDLDADPIVHPNVERGDIETLPLSASPAMEAMTDALSLPPTAQAQQIPWPTLLLTIWLTGVIVLSGHVLVCSIRHSRRFARLPTVADPTVIELLNECRARIGVRSGLGIAESPEVSSPALHGFLRPRLLLPEGFVRSFSPRELRFVLLHELAHVKRRDVLMNWIVTLLQILHWFNPVLWLGFARWRADRELACDALALEAAGAEQNVEYGHTILRLLESVTRGPRVPGLVGILEDKRQLRLRIQMIANFTPGKRWGTVSLLLLVGLGVVSLTDAQAPRAGDETSPDISHASPELFDAGVVEEPQFEIEATPQAPETNFPARVPAAEIQPVESAQRTSDTVKQTRQTTDEIRLAQTRPPSSPQARTDNREMPRGADPAPTAVKPTLQRAS